VYVSGRCSGCGRSRGKGGEREREKERENVCMRQLLLSRVHKWTMVGRCGEWAADKEEVCNMHKVIEHVGELLYACADAIAVD